MIFCKENHKERTDALGGLISRMISLLANKMAYIRGEGGGRITGVGGLNMGLYSIRKQNEILKFKFKIAQYTLDCSRWAAR